MPSGFREQLPDGCPPHDATEGDAVVYRLVHAVPPTDDDFRSQRHLRPEASWGPSVTECQARGLSVFLDATDARRQQRYAQLRNTHVCAIALAEGAGPLHAFRSRDSHRTWWPREEFDILGHCEVLA